MQHSTATTFLLAFALHLLATSTLPANEHQSFSLDAYNLDMDLPFIGQSDPESPTFPLLTVDPQTASIYPGLPPAVKLLNDICTPYQPIFNSSKATLQLSTGLKAYNSSHNSMGTMQFDIFSSTNCSNGTLLDTVWPQGDTIFTRIAKEQEPRMYHLKSVRVREMKEEMEAMPGSWNETAIYCHDDKVPCVKRNETKHGPHMAHKRHGLSGWMAHERQHKRQSTSGRKFQYGSVDCTPTPNDEPMVIPQDGAVPDLPSGYPFPPFVMGLHKVDCQPWYPRLNQTQGPSLGITFGTGSEKINRLQIFKSNDICVSDWNENKNTASCCEAKNGGLLGTIHENGKGDFGADYDLGPEGGACVRLGPGFDQTLWQMRYYKAT